VGHIKQYIGTCMCITHIDEKLFLIIFYYKLAQHDVDACVLIYTSALDVSTPMQHIWMKRIEKMSAKTFSHLPLLEASTINEEGGIFLGWLCKNFR
jgi:hypothetical protein